MRHVYLVTLFLCVLGVSILGFRGQTFTLPPLDQWPEPLRFLYEERWRIRFWEAGQDEEAAKAAALVEVWEKR